MSSLVRILTASIILILITTSFANAQTDLADYLSQKIYNDCSGQDIEMSEAIVGGEMKIHESIINLLAHQNKSYLVKNNLTLKELTEITTVLTNNEPYDFYLTPEDTGFVLLGKDGRNILYCGNKSLTINLMTYYWNGKRIDPFVVINQKVENISQKVDKIENYYTNASGQSNIAMGSNSSAKSEEKNIGFNIKISELSFPLSLISLSLSSLSVYLVLRWKNNKSKDNK